MTTVADEQMIPQSIARAGKAHVGSLELLGDRLAVRGVVAWPVAGSAGSAGSACVYPAGNVEAAARVLSDLVVAGRG